SCELKMYVRCSLACVLQGAALLLLLHLAPRGALGAAACGAGAELTCADRGREEHDADEEALIQVRPSGRDESNLLSRLVAVGLDDLPKNSSNASNSSKDMPDAVNSTIKSAVDKANETLRSAMEAVNGALDWLTDAMNANKSSSSSGAAAVEEAEPANATADELTNASDASEAQPPRACCAAVTAKCLACLLNVSVEEYCQSDPHSVGCGDEVGAGGALGAAPCGGEEPCGAAAEGSKIAPFGNEEMAARLEEQAGKTQD
ncbi:unnamed protein product, partial [Prorocentrum cordatum]